MISTYREIRSLKRKYSGNIIIYYYKTPPSLRGMSFDDYFYCTGWYVQFPDATRNIGVEICGHNQPEVRTTKYTQEGSLISNLFDTQFDKLLASKIDVNVVTNYWITNKRLNQNESFV